MSGDVQPRKRKDKKRKKDDLGVEEPRGTAAALGEGDVFMHSHHDHGTGGHWCAKVIFFSLLFILVGLIGLIILENRGLSELEANAVQSQYSGVLEGWLEDAPEDDHHDEHTLELTHHDEDEHEEEEEDTSLELEKIEKEAPEDEEPISNELPALSEPEDDDDNKDQDSVEYEAPDSDDADDGDDADDADDEAIDPDDDFLEADDDEPPVERITAPAGKPFVEVEEPSTEKPTNTLAEEEEYEKRQEQVRREEAEASSKIWLKLTIGGALLVATQAIIRRATASSDAPRSEEGTSRETTPIDRRMTLIPEEPSEPVPIKKVPQESSRPAIQEITKHIPSITRKSPTFEESEEEVEEEEEEEPVFSKVVRTTQAAKVEEKKELYSDEEEADDEDMEEEEPVVLKKAVPAAAKAPAAAKPKEPTPEPEEDVPDDVEIIDEEQIDEDEEAEDEEEISDVDDEELLTRLEAKYGRLPEPERPARRKDGGNSLEAGWPGEPADAYWRQQLDEAEREYNQDWLD